MISQTTPVKPNRKERRALERKMRKERKRQTTVTAVPTPTNLPQTDEPAPPYYFILRKIKNWQFSNHKKG